MPVAGGTVSVNGTERCCHVDLLGVGIPVQQVQYKLLHDEGELQGVGRQQRGFRGRQMRREPQGSLRGPTTPPDTERRRTDTHPTTCKQSDVRAHIASTCRCNLRVHRPVSQATLRPYGWGPGLVSVAESELGICDELCPRNPEPEVVFARV